jgi:hypothetical protein
VSTSWPTLSRWVNNNFHVSIARLIEFLVYFELTRVFFSLAVCPAALVRLSSLVPFRLRVARLWLARERRLPFVGRPASCCFDLSKDQPVCSWERVRGRLSSTLAYVAGSYLARRLSYERTLWFAEVSSPNHVVPQFNLTNHRLNILKIEETFSRQKYKWSTSFLYVVCPVHRLQILDSPTFLLCEYQLSITTRNHQK